MNGGRIFPYQDEDGQPVGPSRVWLQHQNIPGLAMTRSFGDYVASTVGVIDEPEIYNYPLMKGTSLSIPQRTSSSSSPLTDCGNSSPCRKFSTSSRPHTSTTMPREQEDSWKRQQFRHGSDRMTTLTT